MSIPTISRAKLLTALRTRLATYTADETMCECVRRKSIVDRLTKDLADAKADLAESRKASFTYTPGYGLAPNLREAIATLELLDLPEIPLSSKHFSRFTSLL